MARAVPRCALALALASCAPHVDVGEIDWRTDSVGRCMARSDGIGRGHCIVGPDDVANTYVVEVFRSESTTVTGRCRPCINGLVECESVLRVRTVCRCGGGTASLDEHVMGLSGLALGDLDPTGSYCLRIVALYVPENSDPDDPLSGECPASFDCEGALAERTIVGAGTRTCSVSDWWHGTGEVLVSEHVCRDSPAMGRNIEQCLGRLDDRFLCDDPP